ADIAGDEENTEFDHHPRDGVVSWWENRTIAVGPPPGCTDPKGCEPPCPNPKGCEPPSARRPLEPPSCDEALRCPAGATCGDVARRALGRAIKTVAETSSGLPPVCAAATIEGLQTEARRAGEAIR